MPIANNNGIRIHYEVIGSGPPVLLRHGYGGWLENWIDCGYVDALKDDYQLILMNARGHGQSDKPHEPDAYLMVYLVTDVLSVLDDLAISRAVYWGYSGGGRVGWGLAKTAPEAICALILGGKDPSDAVNHAFASEVLDSGLCRRGIEHYVARMEQYAGAGWDSKLDQGYHRADLQALDAYAQALQEQLDLTSTLPDLSLPCLAYVGSLDESLPGLRVSMPVLPQGTLVELPGLNHFEAFVRSDLVLPHVLPFLARVTGEATGD